MGIEPKNYDHLLGNLNNLSESQLQAHFKLYQGYVKKLNEIENMLKEVDPGQANYSFGLFSELRRRQPVAFNGAYLHELYFNGLKKNAGRPSMDLVDVVEQKFGSWDNWVNDVIGTAMSGPGWTVVSRSRVDGTIKNSFVMEHHRGLPVHQDIIMVVDSWEHAFMIDYGNGRQEYLRKLMESDIDWQKVSERYDACKSLKLVG